MKRWIALLLCALLLCGCAAQPQPAETTAEPTEETVYAIATDADIAQLESLYAGREACHGDMHNHSASSEFSDGKKSLREWRDQMMYILDVDFANIVDHRQLLHMWHEDWDDRVFVGGSEPGLFVTDCNTCTKMMMDYAMIFTNPEGLEAVLNTYPEDYQYNKKTGRFISGFSGDHARIAEMFQCVKDNGGMVVQVHPKLEGYFDSTEPMDYWFADEVGFEVINGLRIDLTYPENYAAYETWLTLLDNGKRLWATAGGDTHTFPRASSLSTLYASKKNAEGYFEQMRVGDLTAGPVGIRMCIGDAVTGSVGSFAGNRVVVAVGDFHSQAVNPANTYRVDLYDDKGLILSQEISTTEMNYIAIDADPEARFYRANVYDVTRDYIFAVGNPIWNG